MRPAPHPLRQGHRRDPRTAASKSVTCPRAPKRVYVRAVNRVKEVRLKEWDCCRGPYSRTMDERKRQAEERRRRILNAAQERLERIGAPLADPSPPPRPEQNAHPSPTGIPPRVVSEGSGLGRKGNGVLERAATVMHGTRRVQIAVAAIVAALSVLFEFESMSPLTWLLMNEV